MYMVHNRSGPFSSVSVNASKTHCCVYSSLVNFPIVFEIPQAPSVKLVQSQPLLLPNGCDLVKWHPTCPSLILALVAPSSLLLFNIDHDLLKPVASVVAEAPIVDFDFLHDVHGKASSVHAAGFSLLCLSPKGSVVQIWIPGSGKCSRRCPGQSSSRGGSPRR